jgi:hypothetical protein
MFIQSFNEAAFLGDANVPVESLNDQAALLGAAATRIANA